MIAGLGKVGVSIRMLSVYVVMCAYYTVMRVHIYVFNF